MSRHALHRQVMFECSRTLDISCEALEVARLQESFSELFDKASDAVTKLGLDLDDVIVERSLLCAQNSQPSFKVISPPLADYESLITTIQKASGIEAIRPFRIIEARIQVTREADEVPMPNDIPIHKRL
jgi:hypothetical protein